MALKVLIVDNDPGSIKFLGALLREHGFETCFAEDGVEGLLKIEEEKPGLVILDVMMPRKSGLSLLVAMRNQSSTKDIPVIILTASPEIVSGGRSCESTDPTEKRPAPSLMKDIENLRSEGNWMEPDILLDKPVDPDVLIYHIQKLISRSGM